MRETRRVLIDFQSVSKTYRVGSAEVRALWQASLSIREGDFLAVAGPSGSGKTTFLNLAGGLDAPTSGKVLVEGRCLSDLGRRQLVALRLHRIGFVFQAYNLIPVLTAHENVEYPLVLAGIDSRERRRRVEEMLEAVGIADLARRRPAELSGGQQQRVAIARALIMRPAVVLADEPTANLDSHTAEGLLEMMRKLNQDRRTTFVFSTHDPMVMDAARRLVRLRDGRIVSDEDRAE